MSYSYIDTNKKYSLTLGDFHVWDNSLADYMKNMSLSYVFVAENCKDLFSNCLYAPSYFP